MRLLKHFLWALFVLMALLPEREVAVLKIYLSSILRKYIPDYSPDKGHEAEILEGTTISALCTQIGVPVELVTIAMVDGKIEGHDHVLKGTERIYLFPSVGGG